MFGKFWGDHMEGKLTSLLDLINEDNPDICVKVMSILEDNNFGTPQLLLTDKPSKECLNKMGELYHIRIFQNDNIDDEYRYLMTIETLRFSYSESWLYGGDPIEKSILGNRYDFDGYFCITDMMNTNRRIALIPYAFHAHSFDGGDNVSKNEALAITREFVKILNDKIVDV